MGGKRLLHAHAGDCISHVYGHEPHRLKPGDNVWSGARQEDLACSACSCAQRRGANAIGVISDETKARFRHVARRARGHQPQGFRLLGPVAESEFARVRRLHVGRRKFGKAIWSSRRKDVDIVFEHPGEQTFPVSCFVVKRGGMVVFCAGTTGFNLTFDARFVWMRQKRIQGSHFAHLKQAAAANQS